MSVGWAYADHACRTCLGRIVVSYEDGIAIYSCGNCKAACGGTGPHMICGCGIRLTRRPRSKQARDELARTPLPTKGPRFHCEPGPSPGPAVVIVFGDWP